MGSIRTLLAISVLITHSEPIFGVALLSGDMAITCFFIVSGFLMGLILDGKYTSRRTFYINRALRIYPPYLVALVFSAAVFLTVGAAHHDPAAQLARLWENGDAVGLVWAAVSNLTLIGIDWTRYAGLSDGHLVFPRLFHPDAGGAHNLLFVPQGWTLALELQYYLLAPFVARMSWRRLVVLIVSTTVVMLLWRRGFSSAGLKFDVMSFFPLQAQYFLMGALGYRVYRALKPRLEAGGWPQRLAQASLPAALALVVFGFPMVGALHGVVPGVLYLFYATFAALVPFVFFTSRRWAFDRWIGEFSYPVYLFHFAVVGLLKAVPAVGAWHGEAVLAVTLALCAAYIHLIDRPLQAYRARVAAATPAPVSVPSADTALDTAKA